MRLVQSLHHCASIRLSARWTINTNDTPRSCVISWQTRKLEFFSSPAQAASPKRDVKVPDPNRQATL